MHPLWTLAIGVAIVIGGVLVLRLHAFLALVLAALAVGALTSTGQIERYAVEKNALTIEAVDLAGGRVTLAARRGDGPRPGAQYLVLRAEENGEGLREIATVHIEHVESAAESGDAKRAGTVALITDFEPEESPAVGDLAISPEARAAAAALARQTVGERVAAGFGSTCAKIGILIALAAIIGKCLLESGAADRIVRSFLARLGERGAPVSFVASGFLLGIPVFFDTVFYLMVPLGKAMRLRTGRNYLLYVLTIVTGATMAHSLVPPTPGPLFVAEELGVDLGVMILAGSLLGLFTTLAGCAYASLMNSRYELPLRHSTDLSMEDLKKLAQRDIGELPPLWISLVPILLPVVLIGGYTVLKAVGGNISAEVMVVAASLGNKNIAMVISAIVAMGLLVWQQRTSLVQLSESVQAALLSAGVIILITAAGGAFGQVIQQTGVSRLIGQPEQGSLSIIVLAFLVTAAVRSAQGSGTVAMITATGILSGIAVSGQLGFHPVYLALAIGCGSKPIQWMNDSGFWVICKMSGMTDREGLRYITPLTSLMGLVGLGMTLLAAWLLPMAGP